MSAPVKSRHIARLLEEQRRDWPLLAAGHAALDEARYRTFDFGGFVMRVQWNPGRFRSTSALVDEASVRARPCFLCAENRPPEQRGLPFRDGYTILCNPYPIFREHLTIVHEDHRPQRIAGSIRSMLDLASALGDAFVVLYNGPACGASAPDHLHFQAGEKGFLPLVSEYERIREVLGTPVFEGPDLRCLRLDGYLRTVVCVEGADPARVETGFHGVCRALSALRPGSGDEPMMNLLCWREGPRLRLAILPRARHRPSFYLAEGEARILLSPATVDLGGVCVTPLERDFHRVTRDDLDLMCREVCLSGRPFDRLCEVISAGMASVAAGAPE